MEATNTPDYAYLEARRHVRKLKSFYGNLIAYIIVNAFLIAVNLLTTPHNLWFFWPLLGWGIGLVFHAIGTFRPFNLFGRDWEERKVREYMQRHNQQRSSL